MPNQKSVTVYTTRVCPYCVAAKNFLQSRNIAFTEIAVDNDDAKRQWLVAATGQRTVPQIFIGETSIGGFSDMMELDKQGHFEAMLQQT
jgi:glutaredoxin 3